MRYFQALLLVLLTAITLELGLVITKLPTPTVQAQAPSTNLPEDPHETLKRQVADVAKRLGAIESQLTVIRQAMPNMARPSSSGVSDDSKRLLMTCYMVAQMFWSGPGRLQDIAGQLSSPQASQPPRDKMDQCTSRFWKSAAFSNFDIPFGP